MLPASSELKKTKPPPLRSKTRVPDVKARLERERRREKSVGGEKDRERDLRRGARDGVAQGALPVRLGVRVLNRTRGTESEVVCATFLPRLL